jgi:hypothetical protein
MRDFSLRLNEILEMAERTPGFFEVEISFCIRLLDVYPNLTPRNAAKICLDRVGYPIIWHLSDCL